MKKHGWIVFLLVIVVLGLGAYSSAFIVSSWQVAIVTTFGKAGEPIVGQTQPDGTSQAGLHWKWPWPVQKLIRYDARTFVLEGQAAQVPTKDQLSIVASTYCAWRIKDPMRFLSSIKTTTAARQSLRGLLGPQKKDVIGRYPLAALVNTNSDLVKMDEMEDKIHKAVARKALEDYGIEVVTLGFRSLSVPKKVSETIIANMKSDREVIAAEHRNLGDSAKTAIEGRANTARRQIMAYANNLAARIRARGVSIASQDYDTFAKDEDFAIFLRRLEMMRKAFATRTMFFLDPTVEAGISFFKDGPSLNPEGGPGPDTKIAPADAANPEKQDR